jgi:preprotein translocase subunit SecE
LADETASDAPLPRGAPTPHAAGRTGLIQFLRECWAELGRVQWPNRSQLWQATAVVVIACLVVGVYLYALDSVFSKVAKWLVTKQAG